MNIKPLADRIVIKRDDSKEKSTGGILLPDSAKNKPQRGKVLAVGPGKVSSKDGKVTALQVKVGDNVLFTNWAGDEFKQSRGDDVLLMREEDVLAVIDS
ncbi:MAG: co-chaperone GroES [Candidatus Acidiferrum sp.]